MLLEIVNYMYKFLTKWQRFWLRYIDSFITKHRYSVHP